MQTECICDLLMNNFKPQTIVKMCINYIKRKEGKKKKLKTIENMILWTHYRYVKLWPENEERVVNTLVMSHVTYLLYCNRCEINKN